MKKYLFLFCLTFFKPTFSAKANCDSWFSWFKPICTHTHDILANGSNDLYIPLYAWHNRATYPKEKTDRYNEFAAGAGFGKGLYNERGNWEGLFAMAFLDSHKNIEPAVGYGYLFTKHANQDFKLGFGPALFITARPDIFNNIPFPALLPWFNLTYKRATLSATYIPGARNAGNVLFVVSRWRL